MNNRKNVRNILLGLVLLLSGGVWNHFGSGKPIWQTLSFFVCLGGLILLIRSIRDLWKSRKKPVPDQAPEGMPKNKLT